MTPIGSQYIAVSWDKVEPGAINLNQAVLCCGRGIAARLRALDRVVLATVVLLVALAALAPPTALDSAAFAARSLTAIAPLIALSALLAAWLAATGADDQMARAFRGRPVRAVLLAGGLGAISPLCNMSVVPLIGALLRAGVPLAPVMAFWIGSPLIDPEMFILTAAIVGPDFALVRTLSAVALGLLAGFATLALERRGAFGAPLRPGAPGADDGVCAPPDPLRATPIHWRFWRDRARRATFRAALADNGWFLAKWLALAFLLEHLLVEAVPAESMTAWLGHGAWWVIPASAAAGMPLYLNGYAATPLIDGLLGLGMPAGAALAFLIAGEIASLPQAIAVAALVRLRVLALYLGLGLAGAVGAGLALQASGWLPAAVG